MATSSKKKFYKAATVAKDRDAFHVELDGKLLRTPRGQKVASPRRALCEEIAREWNAQDAAIDYAAMPVTRIVNSALDQVSANRHHVVEELTAFARTDLIYHEADSPEVLIQKQRDAWGPLRDWASHELRAPLAVATGIIAVSQPDASVDAIRRRLAALDDVGLAAVHLVTKLSGSVVIGLAVSSGRLSGEEAWAASRVDETWQIETWGEDQEAAELARSAERDVCAGASVSRILRETDVD